MLAPMCSVLQQYEGHHQQQQLQLQQQMQQMHGQVAPQGLGGADMSLEAATLAAQQIMNQQQVRICHGISHTTLGHHTGHQGMCSGGVVVSSNSSQVLPNITHLRETRQHASLCKGPAVDWLMDVCCFCYCCAQMQVGGYMDAHPHLPQDVLRGLPPHLMALDDELAAAAAGIAAGGGGGGGSKRRNRGSRIDDIIKAEQDGFDCDDR